MIEFEKHTLAIVVSDVHLGNEYYRIQEFEAFLNSILLKKNRGELPFLRILIVLGDLFDLNATNYEDLCTNQEYFEIYQALEALKEKNIEIIFVLGNHEISTTGFYNLEFDARKIKFIADFRKNGFNFKFLDEDNVCQYLILTDNTLNKIQLELFGSKWEIPFRVIPVSNLAFSNNECYFMTHGYLFENKGIHHIISPIWSWSKIQDSNIKKDISIAWQGVKQILDFDQNPIEKNRRFYKKIKRFVKENENYSFTHIIFGHTHESDKFNEYGFWILNSGCWCKNKNPSFIEIYVDGISDVFSLRYKN